MSSKEYFDSCYFDLPVSNDVAATQGRLIFPPGSRLAVITISITDDSIAERDENFMVGLEAPAEPVNIGGDNTITVTIRDNDGIIS